MAGAGGQRGGRIEATLTDNIVELPEGTLGYHRAGGDDGPPVVLLHGGGLDTALISWKRTIPALAAAGYRVYAPDWPGHGGSRPWDGRATQEALESVVGRLLDVWGLEGATLVGLSMGGSAALGFALKSPGRVERLVLVDSGGLQEKARLHRLGFLLLRAPLLPRLAALPLRSRAVVRYSLKNRLFKTPVPDLEEITGGVHAEFLSRGTPYSDWQLDEVRWRGLKTNHMPRLGGVRCPTLVVHGTEDGLVPVGLAREAANRVPDARLEVVEGCGHWPPRERPEEFNAALLSFLGVGKRRG